MTDYISRANAIEHLKNVKVSYPHADISLPIDLAIKAIEILPSADAISREEYEDIIKDYRKQYENMNNEIADLEAKLSADAVQGEWIDMEINCNPYPPIFCVECSRCGYRVGRETFLENTFNFCPSCGARMKGGEE